MLLDAVFLLSTLAIALIGTTTTIADTAVGKIVISALLVVSTGLSLWLKREETKRNNEVQRGIKRLTAATLPADEFVDQISSLLGETRLAEGYRRAATTRTVRSSTSLLIIQIYWHDEPAEDVDAVAGFVVLDNEDLEQLALLDDQKLRKAVREVQFGKWGSDNLHSDSELIASRVFNAVAGWIEFLRIDFPTYSNTASYDDGTALTALRAEISDDPEAPGLEFDRAELDALLALPALERGVSIAKHADAWLAELSRHYAEQQPPDSDD